MGESDIMRIYPIYKIVTNQCKEFGWPFQFKEDLGTYETAFLIKDGATTLPTDFKDWEEVNKNGWTLQEPDICDYYSKIIIEFEEETGPKKSGAKYAKKGHGHPGDLSTLRDTKRDKNYSGFKLCKIWESEPMTVVEVKLHYFLADCYTKRDLSIYTNGFLTVEEFSKARTAQIKLVTSLNTHTNPSTS